jgi:hypothetical protein
MFSPQQQLLQIQKTAGKASTVISSYKRVVPDELKPHKIAAIKKHIYDSKDYRNQVI